MLLDILHQTILILAHTEEICLFRGPFDRTAAVRTFAVYNLRFGEKRFARFTVPSFVTALINIALFVELFEDFLYNALMLFVSGADKLVIGRVHQIPDTADLPCDVINIGLRRNAGRFCAVLNFLAVLIRTGQKIGIVAL